MSEQAASPQPTAEAREAWLFLWTRVMNLHVRDIEGPLVRMSQAPDDPVAVAEIEKWLLAREREALERAAACADEYAETFGEGWVWEMVRLNIRGTANRIHALGDRSVDRAEGGKP